LESLDQGEQLWCWTVFHLELGSWWILRWKFGNFNMLKIYLSVKPYISVFQLA
jgi:hypothetical protein